MNFNALKLPSFHDLDDAFWINQDKIIFPKIDDRMIILGRANISRGLKLILSAIVQPNSKRAKGSPFHKFPDFTNLHIATMDNQL
jgi:hypothetical protein